MKAYVVGVKRVAGIGKESGQAFEMCRVLVGTPIESVSNEKFSVQGFGLEVNEIPMEPSALPQFKGLTFPAVMELQTDFKPYKNKLEVFVVGVEKAPAVAPAPRVAA
jgi:hypothetical protein